MAKLKNLLKQGAEQAKENIVYNNLGFMRKHM